MRTGWGNEITEVEIRTVKPCFVLEKAMALTEDDLVESEFSGYKVIRKVEFKDKNGITTVTLKVKPVFKKPSFDLAIRIFIYQENKKLMRQKGELIDMNFLLKSE